MKGFISKVYLLAIIALCELQAPLKSKILLAPKRVQVQGVLGRFAIKIARDPAMPMIPRPSSQMLVVDFFFVGVECYFSCRSWWWVRTSYSKVGICVNFSSMMGKFSKGTFKVCRRLLCFLIHRSKNGFAVFHKSKSG